MRLRRPFLFLAAATLGCAANSKDDGCCAGGGDGCCGGSCAGDSAALAAQPWQVDPYTTTEQIIVDGSPVGYLVTYDAIPDGLPTKRAMTTGARRILDGHFEDIGFVSPRGLFFRHAKGGTEELGYHELRDGLGRFFDAKSRTQLVAFAMAPRKPAAASAAAADGAASAGDEASGEGAAEESSGS